MSLEPPEPRSTWSIGPRGAHASAVESSEHKTGIAPKDCGWAGFAHDSDSLSRTQSSANVFSDPDAAGLPDHGRWPQLP
jgi:glutamate/tyrosine decarboxylase-like PLP-dependent enzyme